MKKQALISSVLALLLLLPSCSRRKTERDPTADTGGGKTVSEILADRDRTEPEFFVDGTGYARKKDVTAVLFMGIDKAGDNETANPMTGGQCDVLLLLVNDGEEKRQTILQINRDTMTEVELLDANGKPTGITKTQQICFSHTYGRGDEKSCENTVRAVSRLLGEFGEIGIEGYVALLYEAIPSLNDRVGGVEVKVTDDLTSADPALKAGSTVTLRGSQTLAFIRSRMSVADGTNKNRMGRQRTYLSAFSAKLKAMMKENASIVNDLYADAEPYMVTNLSVGRVSSIAVEGADYANGGILAPEGEYTEHEYATGAIHVEFRPDETSLREAVLALFYKPVSP